jgi:hypothetical protein
MNRENLQRMADFIRTVPQDKFSMREYRSGDITLQECNSVGCVVGWCTLLDKKENIPLYKDGNIDFEEWSIKFTGMGSFSNRWDWCFSMDWCYVDNTPEGAALRIEWLLNKGLPEDWDEQMRDRTSLCYK